MNNSIIKVCICGSVDDGKSSLVGRILYETGNIFADQSLKLQSLSKRYGTTGSKIDYALALDGLQAEREQGITIDVAHKFINYKDKRIIFCDSPGHKQYTKNVFTAASQCNVGVILLDINKGILEQTLRHIATLDFVGIKNIIFAVNKMDSVSYKKIKFEILKKKINLNTKNKNFKSINIIPISALNGDNLIIKSSKMKWYKKDTLMNCLLKTKFLSPKNKFGYISIQHVHRPHRKIRHFMGIQNGQFIKNDNVVILPSKQKTVIKSIFTDSLIGGRKSSSKIISFATKDEVDINRGDVLIKKNSFVKTGNAFNASICVLSDQGFYSGRSYIIKLANKESTININRIKNKLNFGNNKKIIANELSLNEIGDIEFNCDESIVYAPFDKFISLSTFILIDRENYNIVAAGKINFALNRSENIFVENNKINQDRKNIFLNQKPKCIWLTGISASGKSTIAKALEADLIKKQKITILLDADNLRMGINKNLGFSKNDRIENIRRIAEVAKLVVENGLIAIVACISPYEYERQFTRSLFKKGQFFEVFVNTPLSICKKRDPKGLYKKSKKNKTIDKTGLSNLYEKPKHPDLEIDASRENINSIVNKIRQSSIDLS
jgi:bifunctional enzyme CysN/CysC